MNIKKIAVFCGSNSGFNSEFTELAQDLGRLLVRNGIGLVYGGGQVGMMGSIAKEVIKHGGKVYGVIPRFMREKELAYEACTELIVTEDMHERKAKMVQLADGFIALPGGIGTLEELIEVFTWLQLKIHRKPVALLNHNGYYNYLLKLLTHMVDSGLMKDSHMSKLIHAYSSEKLLEKILQTKYVEDESWYVTN